MRIFLDHGSKAGTVASHMVFVAPAADKSAKTACPGEWVDDDNKPLEFRLEFRHGAFDNAQSGVPDSVLKYMLDRGLALKRQTLFRAA